VSAEQKETMTKLSKLSGADFDKAYVDAMVDDHEHDVKDFQEQANEGKDADLKAFAAKTLPVIQHHLQMIKEIKAKM
jgi:putative membrane protein